MYFQFCAFQSSMRTPRRSRRGPELSLCAQSTQSLYYPTANHVRIFSLSRQSAIAVLACAELLFT